MYGDDRLLLGMNGRGRYIRKMCKRKGELPLFISDWKPANQKSLIALEKAKTPSLSGLSPHHHTTTFLFDTRAPFLHLQSIAHLL